MPRPFLVVIDPGVKIAEVDCFNRIALASPLPCSYHLPAMAGLDSLAALEAEPAGLVILGSASSVHDRLPWQTALEDWLRPRIERAVPTLAICYGHQMIAHMYGAKVAFTHEDKRKRTGFHEVRLAASSLWGAAKQGKLYESHREIVTGCPAGMRAVATSDGPGIEAMTHDTLPLWTFQAHPEATPDFVRNRGEVPPEKTTFAFGWSLVDAFVLTVSAKH